MVSYRRLFEALDRARIEYLIAGGFAVNLHQVQRATVDLDLIVQLTTGNLEAFVELMTTLGYRPRLPVDSRDFAKQEIRESWIRERNMTVFSFFNPSNPLEHVDVFVREPKPFGQLKENRFEVKAFGLVLPVLGLDDLIELKKTAGRDKDLFDVSQLEKKKDGN